MRYEAGIGSAAAGGAPDRPAAPAPARPLRRGLTPRRTARGVLSWLALAGALALGVVQMHGCRGTAPETEEAAVRVQVDVVPLILPADTTETASVWITVLAEGEPVADSTRIDLLATLGSISAEAYTRDGLAVTSYRAAAVTGNVAIIAQARGVRDTMNITLY